jgi:hypothetical protein
VAPGFHFRFAIPSRGDHRRVVRTTRHDTTLTYSDEGVRVRRRALTTTLITTLVGAFPWGSRVVRDPITYVAIGRAGSASTDSGDLDLPEASCRSLHFDLLLVTAGLVPGVPPDANAKI